MKTVKNYLCITLLFVMSVSTVTAQKVNFSGYWKLNKEKSDFGKISPNSAPVRATVKQESKQIIVEWSQVYGTGDSTVYTEKLNLDGTPSEARIIDGKVKTSLVKWSEDGMKLMVTSRYSSGMTGQVVWSLVDNGRVLMLQRTINGNDYPVSYSYNKRE